MDWDRPELAKCDANHVALSPIAFLHRAATFFARRTAVIDRERRFSYAEFYDRTRRLAHALSKAGVGRGDTVAIIAANVGDISFAINDCGMQSICISTCVPPDSS